MEKYINLKLRGVITALPWCHRQWEVSWVRSTEDEQELRTKHLAMRGSHGAMRREYGG